MSKNDKSNAALRQKQLRELAAAKRMVKRRVDGQISAISEVIYRLEEQAQDLSNFTRELEPDREADEMDAIIESAMDGLKKVQETLGYIL